MARAAIALFGLFLLGCAGPRPPQELAGLWSVGPAACAAGVGVRFRAGAIEAVYDDEAETLFSRPRYEIQDRTETEFRVRIVYDLPPAPGGAGIAGAHGVLILARQPDGGIAPEAHTLIDGLTGAARVRIADDPATALLSLGPCGAHPWREDLRGRVSA
ncbi:MAG TPA: hypothetical protein VEA80_03545 [Vitreimonas sp.]|uniref:hypothetical protein n=1 Tax=Vitreimonas sp. TaxID=3069702 RepID=UPI002D71E989|nr:hypothetical protein [Vitreimonas sp.]HYD86523.1 hypothetical protein [Vitreimonas sp.]